MRSNTSSFGTDDRLIWLAVESPAPHVTNRPLMPARGGKLYKARHALVGSVASWLTLAGLHLR